MPLSRHALSALVLFVAGALLAPAGAEAGDKRKHMRTWEKILKAENEDVILEGLIRRRLGVVVGSDTANEVASVDVRMSSDGGDEDLVLTESDAWLHGGADLSALPGKDAALTLTLYDTGSASLMRFSGTLTADGVVTLDKAESTGPCEVVSKVGCVVVEYDVEVLGAEVYASGKGYALTFDLAGADTYEVAYATVEVAGAAKAEVDWDSVGSVWEAEPTIEHTGVIRVKATARDATGRTVENLNAELAEPWHDDGEGVSALSAGAGTSVAVHRWGGEYGGGKQPGTWSGSRDIMTVVSGGWSTTTYPTHAELELAGGAIVTVPANSYQRTGDLFKIGDEVEATVLSIDRGDRLRVSSGGAVLFELTLADIGSQVCSDGLCATLVTNGSGGYRPAFTAYGKDPASLKRDDAVVDELVDDVVAEERVIVFDDEITAVFASELKIDGDPIGGDASGSVSLLGAADKKGRRATLAKGTFYGSFSRDTDGDLGLGGYGTDDWATSDTRAGVLLGDPVECLGSACDGGWGPPVIQYGVGGKVTKIVVSSGGLGYSMF